MVNNQDTNWCSQGCQAIVDTGTSLLTVPGQFFQGLMQNIGAQQNNNGAVGKSCYVQGQKKPEGKWQSLISARYLGYSCCGHENISQMYPIPDDGKTDSLNTHFIYLGNGNCEVGWEEGENVQLSGRTHTVASSSFSFCQSKLNQTRCQWRFNSHPSASIEKSWLFLKKAKVRNRVFPSNVSWYWIKPVCFYRKVKRWEGEQNAV